MDISEHVVVDETAIIDSKEMETGSCLRELLSKVRIVVIMINHFVELLSSLLTTTKNLLNHN